MVMKRKYIEHKGSSRSGPQLHQSELKNMKWQLSCYIKEKNAAMLATCLLSPFYYRVKKDILVSGGSSEFALRMSPMDMLKPRNSCSDIEIHYLGYHCEYRSFIETLFVEDPRFLLTAVRTLINTGDAQLLEAFVGVFDQPEVDAKNIFNWSCDSEVQLRDNITKIENRAKKLEARHVKEKVNELRDISTALSKKLTEKLEKDDKNLSDTSRKIQLLQFKLECLEILYQHNIVLFKPRSTLRDIALNIISALCLFIPNIINYGMTDRFWFSCKTSSEGMLRDVNCDLDLPSVNPKSDIRRP